MKKFNGKLLRFLALLLTVSLLASPEMAVFGATGQKMLGNPTGTDAFGRLGSATGSDAGKDKEAEPVEDKEEEKTATRADALTGAAPKAEPGKLGEMELSGAKLEEEAAMTLLPIEEVNAYISLSDLSDRELRTVSVETILERLKDSNGETIQIADDAEVAVLGYYDHPDEYQIVNREKTLNLSPYIDSSEPEKGLNRRRIESIELIIGSGKQLDVNNVRYNVSIYFSDIIDESIAYYFHTNVIQEDGSYRKRFFWGHDDDETFNQEFVLEGVDIPVTSVQIPTEYYEDGREYYFRMRSEIASGHIGIQVDIYPMKKFIDYYQNGAILDGAITDQVLEKSAAGNKYGYAGTYGEPENPNELLNADNLFCIVYKDANTGRLIGYND